MRSLMASAVFRTGLFPWHKKDERIKDEAAAPETRELSPRTKPFNHARGRIFPCKRFHPLAFYCCCDMGHFGFVPGPGWLYSSSRKL